MAQQQQDLAKTPFQPMRLISTFPAASPPSADHPCGSALLMAWPRRGHSPGLDTGFVHSSFSRAFSLELTSSLAHTSPAALNCSRPFSGPSLRVLFHLASWGAVMSRPWARVCGPTLWTVSVSWLVWLCSLGVFVGLWDSVLPLVAA